MPNPAFILGALSYLQNNKMKQNNGTNQRNTFSFLGLPFSNWIIILCVGLAFIYRKKIGEILTGVTNVQKGTAEVDQYYGSNTPVTVQSVNPAQLAKLAYDAIWGGLGWFEDEEAFVLAVLQCPKELIYKMSIEYAKINNKGKVLQNDAVKYLSETQYSRIRHLLN